MKKSLPLMAVLAATLTTPLLAQDMSAFLNPGALAAQMGLTGPSAAFASPRTSLYGADAAALLGAATIVLPRTLETASYIAVSPRPVMRPRIFGGPVLLNASAADLIEEIVETAPLGSRTTVVTGANTAVISGANTAVIRSNGVTQAVVLAGDSPRLTLWQRIFGL